MLLMLAAPGAALDSRLPSCLPGSAGTRQQALTFCVFTLHCLQTEERLERDAAVADMVTVESAAAEEGQVRAPICHDPMLSCCYVPASTATMPA
jgi:hypothetical protein